MKFKALGSGFGFSDSAGSAAAASGVGVGSATAFFVSLLVWSVRLFVRSDICEFVRSFVSFICLFACLLVLVFRFRLER